jgi:GPI mannosyltransferase 2
MGLRRYLLLTWFRNVGFLRYWTPGNIPLFLLAAPMLTILIKSAWWGIRLPRPDARIMVFAIPQLLLAVAAITNYHTQIILRLSSGNFVWYWWIATLLSAPLAAGGKKNWSPWVVRWMVIYSCIQTVLFAGFLPPA